MNPRIQNLKAFLGAIVGGITIDFLIGGTSASFVGNLGVVSLIAGFALLLFGAPHSNPRTAMIGWGALGLTVGIFTPVIVLLMLYAG